MAKWDVKPEFKPQFIKNQFLSDQEAKLAKFCEDNNINFSLEKDSSGRGKNSYSFNFKPNCIDLTEAKVVQHLEMTGKKYKFAVDENGIHHYEFPEMIEFNYNEYPTYDTDSIKATLLQEMPKIRKVTKETTYLDDDTDIKYIEKEIEQIKSEITKLKEKGDFKNWWSKAWYYIWYPYRKKVKQQVQDNINKLLREIDGKETQILCIKAEKKELREMLILAEVLPEEEIPEPKNFSLEECEDDDDFIKYEKKRLKDILKGR